MKSEYKSVVIEVSLDKDCLQMLKHLKNSPVLENAKKVTLLHVYNDKTDIHLPMDLKNKHDKTEVETAIKKAMNQVRDEIVPTGDCDHWFTQVIYHSDAKLETLQFLKQVAADLVVVATRGNHGATGVFKDSFANYLMEYSPCDVYVLRPVH